MYPELNVFFFNPFNAAFLKGYFFSFVDLLDLHLNHRFEEIWLSKNLKFKFHVKDHANTLGALRFVQKKFWYGIRQASVDIEYLLIADEHVLVELLTIPRILNLWVPFKYSYSVD